ncbi:histidine kinase dimerization/phosphoacceptor domain -containing protein [Flavobacterium cellulosilyticum]|uniref:histidine kinase n=1 Tax=Flavobacterium cellulosilyticum TaxID=2541731 RepID=A0A4R5CKP0_9FLAO|nr:histidine kinase dimerization/phosphoacceptor domain -containing protein [Flavobacterium cellulosilyticum]TDD98022.1 histidine kinase [Flavobacterium cellulosilyticum]
MKKIIIPFLVVIVSIGFAQNNKKLSTNEVLELSKTYQDKGLYFQKIPNFNRDSTVYYLDKAAHVLETNQPIQYRRLAEIFLDITNRRNRSYPFTKVDKLAEIGINYYNQIPDNQKDTFIEYILLTNWASIKVEKGELKDAVTLFSNALHLIQNDPRPEVRAKFLKDKANFINRYGLPEEIKTSSELTNKSFALYKQLDQKKHLQEVTSIYSEKIISAMNTNNDSLSFYVNEFEKLLPKLKNPFTYGWYYCTLSDYYYNKKEYLRAKNLANKGIKMLEKYKMQNVDSYPMMLTQLADFAVEKKEYDKAIEYYGRAKVICETNNFRSFGIKILQSLSEINEKKGDFKKALHYQRAFTIETLKFEKERNERSLLESELKMNVINQEKELIQKNNQQKLYIVALILCIILLVFIYRNVILKQKNNLKLAAFNHELEDKNNLLDKHNTENELLLKEIHHRVKNNLEVVSSLLSLQSAKIDDPNIKDAIAEGQNRINSIGLVHQKLYQGTNLGEVEMKEYFLSVSESILDSIGAGKRIDLKLEMNQLELDIDTAIPLGLIINELLTNAIKYAFPNGNKGTITIKLEKNDNRNLHLEVADNGVGKTAIIQGTGFGGQLISLLTLQLNGTMTEKTQNGTTIIFDFKL